MDNEVGRQASFFPEGYVWHEEANGVNNLITPKGDIFFSYNQSEDVYSINGVQYDNFNSNFGNMEDLDENVYRSYESIPEKTQAKFLPEGWIWTKYLDGSGGLESPSGESIFTYDRLTNEYKNDLDGEWNYGYDEMLENIEHLEKSLFKSFNRKHGIDEKEELLQLRHAIMAKSSESLIEIVRDPNTTSETLEFLSNHSSSLIRQDVAYHKNCSNDVLYKMINDDNPMVKRQVEKKLFNDLEKDILNIKEISEKGNLLKSLIIINKDLPLNIDTLKSLDKLEDALSSNNTQIINKEVNEMFDEGTKKNDLELVKEVHIDV